MATVNATKYGIAGSTLVSSWTTARETGNFVTNQPSTANSTAVLVQRGSKNGVNYRITRSFLAFDLSAYEGQTIIDLTLTFRQTTGTVAGGLEIAILKSTAQGSGSTFSDLTTSDFYSTVDFSTAYANWIPYISSVNSNNVQALTLAAMADASSGSLRLVIVQKSNDALNVTPTSDQTENGNWNLDTSSSGYIPFLTFTAINWGEKVNSVPVTTIEKVNGVPRTTIEAVNVYNLPSGGDDVYQWYVYQFGVATTIYTDIPVADIVVGTVLYLNEALTTVAANIYQKVVSFQDIGTTYCSFSATLLTTNSSGVITAIECAPINP